MSDCKVIRPNIRVCEKGTKGCGVTHNTETHEINLPYDIAKTICEMEGVCFSEGLGPDTDNLMLWIQKTYPALRDEFSYLFWPEVKE